MPRSFLIRCAVFPALAAFLPLGIAEAQDTTRVVPDSARTPDTTRIQVGRIAVPPPVPPPWRFQVDFGFQDVTGNRDLTVANVAFVVERRPRDRLILNLKLEGRYGRSNGVESVNSQLGRIRVDWNPRDRVSPFLGMDVNRDRIRRIARRVQGGTGININTDIRDAQRTYFSFGVLAEHQRLSDSLSSTTISRWMLRGATQRLIAQSTRVEGIAKLQPNTEEAHDYLASVEASVRVSITRTLGVTTKFEWSRDSRPAPGVKPDDRSLTAAVSFTW